MYSLPEHVHFGRQSISYYNKRMRLTSNVGWAQLEIQLLGAVGKQVSIHTQLKERLSGDSHRKVIALISKTFIPYLRTSNIIYILQMYYYAYKTNSFTSVLHRVTVMVLQKK